MQGESEIVQAKHLIIISQRNLILLFSHFFSNWLLILLQVSMVTQVENDGSELRRNVFSPLE
jgi:hypothetical protein